MRKYILLALLIVSALIIAVGISGVIASVIVFLKHLDAKWYLGGSLLVGAFGVKMMIEVLKATKTAEKIDKALFGADEVIAKIESIEKNSKVDRAEIGKLHKENLDTAMAMLLGAKDKLSANQKKMWLLVQKDVPHDNPTKVMLKKKFFTCDFEDLTNPIC